MESEKIQNIIPNIIQNNVYFLDLSIEDQKEIIERIKRIQNIEFDYQREDSYSKNLLDKYASVFLLFYKFVGVVLLFSLYIFLSNDMQSQEARIDKYISFGVVLILVILSQLITMYANKVANYED